MFLLTPASPLAVHDYINGWVHVHIPVYTRLNWGVVFLRLKTCSFQVESVFLATCDTSQQRKSMLPSSSHWGGGVPKCGKSEHYAFPSSV